MAETAPKGRSPRAMADGDVLKGRASGRGLAMTSPKPAKEARVRSAGVRVGGGLGAGMVWTIILVACGE